MQMDQQMQDQQAPQMLSNGDDHLMTEMIDTMPFDLNLYMLQEQNTQRYRSLSPQDHNLTLDTIHDQPHPQNSNLTTDIGAGPRPASFRAQLAPNILSTLPEFTKRRNWSQRIIEEIKDFLHILTSDGRFIYVSPSAKLLTGHDPEYFIGKLIYDFIHPDDSGLFVREFNESIASGNPLRFFYRFRKADNMYTIFESHGHPHFASEAASFLPNSGASFCRGFFMMSRPYPTKNVALLDSFLEHKIENERLRKRIEDLKREEREDSIQSQPSNVPDQLDHYRFTSNPGDHNDRRGYGDSSTQGNLRVSSMPMLDYNSMQPPARPSISSIALTRQNLNEALAASRPDSIHDKMARYVGVTHTETIEMITGLRFREGERSAGISTGAASPVLIKGDAGIAMPFDRDGNPVSGDTLGDGLSGINAVKKKKMKIADEYVCTDCGTLDSPEWRKGPTGPKTLCNACGLRWAKKEKKNSIGFTSMAGESGVGSGSASVPSGNGPGSPTFGSGLTSGNISQAGGVHSSVEASSQLLGNSLLSELPRPPA